MKIKEALEKKIPRVRNPKWANQNAYILLPITETGYGPWASLYDEWGQKAIGVPVGSQKVFVLNILNDDCEEYKEEPHELDKV